MHEIRIAKSICMGDTIEVNLGKGSVARIVDRVQRDETDRLVTITLYAESGRRPRFTVTENAKIKVIPMHPATPENRP